MENLTLYVHKCSKCNNEFVANTPISICPSCGEEMIHPVQGEFQAVTDWNIKKYDNTAEKLTIAPSEKIIIHTDGGSRGNPGPAGCACTIKFGGKTFIKNSFLGTVTNNEAEYTGVVIAVEKLKDLGIKNASVEFKADSKLVIMQLSGVWKIKDARMRDFALRIHASLRNLNITASFTEIPREQNSEADKYANKAMDGIIVNN